MSPVAIGARLQRERDRDRGPELLSDAVRRAEGAAVRAAMRRNGGCQLRAAAELGVHRNTLQRVLNRVGVTERYGRGKMGVLLG